MHEQQLRDDTAAQRDGSGMEAGLGGGGWGL